MKRKKSFVLSHLILLSFFGALLFSACNLNDNSVQGQLSSTDPENEDDSDSENSNPLPSSTKPKNQFIDNLSSTGSLPFTIDDDSSVTCANSVSALSSNTSVIPHGNIVVSGGLTKNCSIDITPLAGQKGTATITIEIDDGTDSVEVDFNVTVVDPVVISATDHDTSGSNTWVELQVDWTNSFAYMGSRESGICVEVVDFSTETAPAVLANGTLGTGQPVGRQTTGNTCKGIELYNNNTRLLISSDGSNQLETWQITDPTTGNYTQLHTHATGVNIRKIMEVESSDVMNPIFYVSFSGGAKKFTYAEGTGTFTNPLTWSGAYAYDHGVILNSEAKLLMGASNSNYAVEEVDFPIVTTATTHGGPGGAWSGARSTDSTKAFIGGWGASIFHYDIGGTNSITRTDNNFGTRYRDVIFLADGGKDYFIAPQNDGFVDVVDVFDVTDINDPHIIHQTDVSASIDNELYAVAADATSRRVIVVGNKGDFLVFDMDSLLTPNETRATITSLVDQTTALNTPSTSQSFTIDDLEQVVDCDNNVTGRSSDQALVTNANIVISGGTSQSCSVVVTPETGQSGTATITIRVNDGIQKAYETFDLTVTP